MVCFSAKKDLENFVATGPGIARIRHVNITIEFPIERDGREFPVAVEFEFTPASRGRRDSCCGVAGAGPAIEPDEPADLEFLGATDEDGGDVALTEREIERAMDRGWDRL